MRRVCEFTNATAEAWPLNAAQERGDSAFLSFGAQGKEDKASRSSRATSLTAGAHRKGQKIQRCQLKALRLSVSNQKNAELPGFRAAVLTSVSEGRYQPRPLPGSCQPPRPQPPPRQFAASARASLSSLARLRPLRQAAA